MATAGIAAAVAVSTAAPAYAAPADKPKILASWTQTSAASQTAWLSAQTHQSDWSAYDFDWSTDYCTASPDNPYGYPFKTPCARHDFGYRNYRAAGQFEANKSRLDSAFYEDMKRVCARYSGEDRTECNSLAKVYYEAVKVLGLRRSAKPRAAV